MAAHGKTPSTSMSVPYGKIVRIFRRPEWAAAATFAVALIAAIGIWQIIHDQSLRVARNRFEQNADHITADLRRELAACESVMRGASGLFAISPAVSADAWRQYVARLDLGDTLPVMRIFGYAAADSRTIARFAEESPGVAQQTPPAEKFVLMAPEPSDTPPLQYDLDNDVGRRTAMLRSIETGDIALNKHATQFNTAASDSRPALELYLPVYRGETTPSTPPARRAAVVGVLVAALNAEPLFDHIIAHQRHIDLQVFAGTPATVLYTSASSDEDATDQSSVVRKTDVVRFGGEMLTLVYTINESNLRASDGYADTAVLIAGLVAAILLAGCVFLMVRERAGPLRGTSHARTQLTLNEARMMGIIRSSMEAIITIDESQRIVIFNPMAEQVFGCSAMEAIGAPLSRFIPERFRAAHAQHVHQFGVTGVSDRQMGRQRVLFGLKTNGEEFPIEASISQIHDGTGKLYTVMLRDVTERVKADNAQMKSREELRELSANLQNVREEEKTRIARELHDDLGQQLTALKMDLSSVEQALNSTSEAKPEILDQLHGMRRLIDVTVASVRRIAADLRPVMLDDLGLIPAIEWLANDFTNRYGIDVERRIDAGDTNFTRNGATTLFRIVQEALTNVARHAEATLVTLTIRTEDGYCVLRIADNGHGASGHNARTDKSFGLLGIRERALMLHGSVEINTASGKGFAITVTFPLQAVQQEEAQS